MTHLLVFGPLFLFWIGLSLCVKHERGRVHGIDVQKVADLARLRLSPEEQKRLGRDLDSILHHVSKITELKLDDVPPTSHPHDLVNVLAADEPQPSLPVEEALANAPVREGNFFKVPG